MKRERSVANEKYEVNVSIRNNKVQVIDENGVNKGEMQRREAIVLAEEAGLDLVKVGQKGEVAIAKIMDFGKFLYSKKKKITQSKKHQKVIQVKEIKMRPSIGIGDYKTKLGHAIKFLKEGKRVKFTLQFKGRQPLSITEVGKQFFERIKNDLVAASLGHLTEEKEIRSGMFWMKVFFIKGK